MKKPAETSKMYQTLVCAFCRAQASHRLAENQPDYRTSLIIPALFFLFCSALFAAPARDRERRIVIELEGNRTTGYSWTYVMEPEGIVREVSAEYREDAGSEYRAGRGGVFVFTFESLKPGTVGLRFGYARPWEKDVEPERTESYLLTVDRAGGIKAAVR